MISAGQKREYDNKRLHTPEFCRLVADDGDIAIFDETP